jgi:hypothetical protein
VSILNLLDAPAFDRCPLIDRRELLKSATALIGSAALPVAATSHDAGLGPATELLARTRAFLVKLDPEQHRTASFAWSGPEWRNWNYFGIGGFIKPGLRLEQMTREQKAAAWDLLAAMFSPLGIEKTRNVMLLQEVLAASGNAAGLRSSERFSFAIFGAPAETGAWGLRLEGHHLTQSFSVLNNRIVSVTPSSFSAYPNRVAAGKHAGLNTLRHEESLARRLYADLSPRLQQRARQSAGALRNILSYAGRERANTQKVGVAAADMHGAQRDLLWQLVETYAVEYLVPALAAAQQTRLRTGDPDAVHFAWYGPNAPEQAFGYRVIADGFVIELGSVDAEAQHLHTIYHDLGNVLGRAG